MVCAGHNRIKWNCYAGQRRRESLTEEIKLDFDAFFRIWNSSGSSRRPKAEPSEKEGGARVLLLWPHKQQN